MNHHPTRKITIAIDGYSSTGKSTVAKRIAKTLGYKYIDTGAMYRAVTLYALEKGYIGEGFFNTDRLIEDLNKITLKFVLNPETGESDMYLNGRNVEEEIRDKKVSGFVSPVAEVPEVRRFLVARQREMGRDKGVVLDGRDIGSVVFPGAEVKFFLTADDRVRAYRRWLEMNEKGKEVSMDDILHNIRERDRIDSTRADSPLVKTADAVEVDVSSIDREEQFERMMQVINEKLKD